MEELLEMLEDIMDLDEGTLETTTVLEDVEEWDSLSALSLMAEAKKNYGKKLSADDITSFVTVQDIIDYLQK
ncbi:MAG: acyl carrier protein [Ruminococcus flavefaciens]|nr:acyl carrier protein [Ruminococcus flavefaciens]